MIEDFKLAVLAKKYEADIVLALPPKPHESKKKESS